MTHDLEGPELALTAAEEKAIRNTKATVPTPRTDRETYTVTKADIGFKVTPVSCATSLERELATLNRCARACYEKLQPPESFEEWVRQWEGK